MRRRRHRRIGAGECRPLPKPAATDVNWSMDLVANEPIGGRRLPCLTIVDDCTRDCEADVVGASIPGARVKAVRCRLADARGLSQMIAVADGRELDGEVLDPYACRTGGLPSLVGHGRLGETACIESANGRFHDECVDKRPLIDLWRPRNILEAWRIGCNTGRPDGSLGSQSPWELSTGRSDNDEGRALLPADSEVAPDQNRRAVAPMSKSSGGAAPARFGS